MCLLIVGIPKVDGEPRRDIEHAHHATCQRIVIQVTQKPDSPHQRIQGGAVCRPHLVILLQSHWISSGRGRLRCCHRLCITGRTSCKIRLNSSAGKVCNRSDIFAALQDGNEERDLLIVQVLGDDPIEAAQSLRERYSVEPGAFAVLLIGKDGGPKNRFDEPVTASEVFGLIDAMPMRIREMREDGE